MSKDDRLKHNVAQAAVEQIEEHLRTHKQMILGIGTGSTVNCLIDLLDHKTHSFHAIVASSKATHARLMQRGFTPTDPNQVSHIDLYVDGMDEINPHKQMIKGGGGALTGEKILATMADQFIAIGDQSKLVDCLGNFPVAIEVLATARSFVARKIVTMGGEPLYRTGFITDHGHLILDVYHLPLEEPGRMEQEINQIPGVVANGIFSQRRADKAFISSGQGTIRSW